MIPDSSWTCPACDHAVEGTFDSCWNCGTSRDGSPAPAAWRRAAVEVTESVERPAARLAIGDAVRTALRACRRRPLILATALPLIVLAMATGTDHRAFEEAVAAARTTVPTFDGPMQQYDLLLLASAGRYLVSVGLPYLMLLPLTTALVIRLVLGVDVPPEPLGRSLSAAFHHWPRLFAIEMIWVLAAAVLFIGPVVAGRIGGAFAQRFVQLVLAIGCFVSAPKLTFLAETVVIDGAGATSAVGRSWETTHGVFWRVFVLGLVLGLLAVPLELAQRLLPASASALTWAFLPFSTAVYTAAYLQLRPRTVSRSDRVPPARTGS